MLISCGKMERFVDDADEMRAKYETFLPFSFLSAILLAVLISGEDVYEASVTKDSVFFH